MKKVVFSTPLATSPYNADAHSSTVLTRIDRSIREIEYPTAQGYYIYVPVCMPQGPTDKRMRLEGNNAYRIWRRLFPQPNPMLYGPNPSYIEDALKIGWGVITVNVADPAATHANVYVYFTANKAAAKKKLICQKVDSNPAQIAIALLTGDPVVDADIRAKFQGRADLDALDSLHEVEYDTYEIGFKSGHFNGLGKNTDLASYLSMNQDINKIVISDSTEIDPSDSVHQVLYGLYYEGRSKYGNKFKLNVQSIPDIDENVPYVLQRAAIVDGSTILHEFDFANFTYVHPVTKRNYDWEANVLWNCKEELSDTNHIYTFGPISHTRKQAMKLEPALDKLETKLIKGIAKAIKVAVPSFDENVQPENADWNTVLLSEVKNIFDKFDVADDNLTETPFSKVNPFAKLWSDNKVMNGLKLEPVLQFAGGESGELLDLLRQNHWDWNIEWQPKDLSVHPFKPLMLDDPLTPGSPKPAPKTKVLIDLFRECFAGQAIIDTDILDPSRTPACIIPGEDYPFDLQEEIDLFVKYQDGRISYEGSRPDFVYIRTPQTDVRTMRDVISWKKSWRISRGGNAENVNTWPLIGYGTYIEPNTNIPVQWSPVYAWITGGSLLNYLSTGVSDSFASRSWSKITGWMPGTARCIPTTSSEKSELAKNSINYLIQKSDNNFYLGEDHTVLDGKISVIKNLGSAIQFGYITCEAYVVLMENRIINPTPDNLLDLKNKIENRIRYYTKHFGNKVEVSVGRSTHEKEINRNVVLAVVGVTGHDYSRHNRLQMEALPSDNGSN